MFPIGGTYFGEDLLLDLTAPALRPPASAILIEPDPVTAVPVETIYSAEVE